MIVVVGTQTRLLGRHKRARATANGSAGCRRPCPPTSATPRRSGLREGAARRAARRCQRCLSCVIRRRWDPASRRLGFARAARAPRRFSFLAASRRRWQLRGAAFSPAACLLRARAPAVRRAPPLPRSARARFAGGRCAAPPSRAGSVFPRSSFRSRRRSRSLPSPPRAGSFPAPSPPGEGDFHMDDVDDFQVRAGIYYPEGRRTAEAGGSAPQRSSSVLPSSKTGSLLWPMGLPLFGDRVAARARAVSPWHVPASPPGADPVGSVGNGVPPRAY